MADSALIATLEKRRQAHETARKAAVRKGRVAEALKHRKAAALLTKQIILARRKGRVPTKPKPGSGQKAPPPITASNAAAMYVFYKRLLGQTSIFNPRLRAYYRGKMQTATLMMRKSRRLDRRAIRRMRAQPGKKSLMQTRAANQRALAQKAKVRKDFTAAQRHEEAAEQFEQAARNATLEPQDNPQSPFREGIGVGLRSLLPKFMTGPQDRDEGTDPDGSLTPEEAQDPEAIEAAVDAEAGVDSEEPWYKRYWMPLAAAGVLGVVAFAGGSKRGGGSRPPGSSKPPGASTVKVQVSGAKKRRPLVFR